MQNLQNLQNLRALQRGFFGSQALISFLTSLVNSKGGVYFPMQELANSVAVAVNPALALGRNVAINGDFTDWTADDPDSWAVTETGDATSNVTENPAGECQIISDGTIAQIAQTMLKVGATYTCTMDINAITGTIQWGSGTATQNLTTTGSKSFDFTPTSTSFFVKRAATCNATIDNVVVKQTNIAASTDFPGSELLTDGDMEDADTSAWTVQNQAILSKETGTRTGGSGSLIFRITRDGDNNAQANETTTTVGKRYRATGWARSDGNATPRVLSGSVVWIGTTSTSWQSFDFEFEAGSINLVLRSTTTTDPEYTEWDDVTLVEVNPLNGDITGATIGVNAGAKLKKAYTFDGANDFVDIHSAEINSLFDPTKGTLLVFAKVSDADVWTDGAERRIVSFIADNDNNFVFKKTTTDNQLQWVYRAGATSSAIFDVSNTPTTFFLIALTWDTVADEVKAYYNGSQIGSTRSTLGTWVGNLNSAFTNIGSSGQPSGVMDGDICHKILFTEVISEVNLLKIAQLGGVA